MPCNYSFQITGIAYLAEAFGSTGDMLDVHEATMRQITQADNEFNLQRFRDVISDNHLRRFSISTSRTIQHGN